MTRRNSLHRSWAHALSSRSPVLAQRQLDWAKRLYEDRSEFSATRKVIIEPFGLRTALRTECIDRCLPGHRMGGTPASEVRGQHFSAQEHRGKKNIESPLLRGKNSLNDENRPGKGYKPPGQQPRSEQDSCREYPERNSDLKNRGSRPRNGKCLRRHRHRYQVSSGCDFTGQTTWIDRLMCSLHKSQYFSSQLQRDDGVGLSTRWKQFHSISQRSCIFRRMSRRP